MLFFAATAHKDVFQKQELCPSSLRNLRLDRVLHAQTAFLFSKVFALCRSEDRIRAISIKNGLVCGRG
jgi:hypothetical protein